MGIAATPSDADSHPAVYHLPVCQREDEGVSYNDTYDAQRDRELLRQNAAWFCQLRWIVIAVLTVAGVAAYFPDWMVRLDVRISPTWPLFAAAALGVANLFYLIVLRRLPESGSAFRVRVLLWVQIVFDLVVLTAVIHFLGSRNAYAPFTYLFHIILACIFFRRMESLVVTAISAALYVGCLLLEYRGILVPHAALNGGTVTTFVDAAGRHVWIRELGSLLSIWAIIWYLASRIATALRERERELAETNRRLRASSEERARHMLQTTHQLKAPFAAIHANTQLLLGGYCGPLPAQSVAVIEKIASRSQMLSQQIQDMLQLANLRSQSQSMPSEATLDLADLIQASVMRMEPVASLRGVRIETHLESVQVYAAEDYMKMLVDNLLSNAVSYSYDGGLVSIVCRPGENTNAFILVRDFGIGIPADKLSEIFQDYYRTKEAAQHNKASSGLGLAIVRQIARALKMSVTVESAPAWGTRFTICLPAVRQDPAYRIAQNWSS